MRIGVLTSARPRFSDNARLNHEITERGHETVFIDYTQTIVAITEEGRQLLEVDKHGEHSPIKVDAIIPRIGRLATAGALAVAIFETNNIPTTASSAAIRLAKNKVLSQIAFDSVGVPTPYSVAPTARTPNNPNEMLKLIEKDKFRPVIIKTTTGSLGRGVVLAESRRSALSQLQGFDAKNVPFLVQEFVEAPDKQDKHSDIRMFVVDGNIVASMRRQSADEDEFRANVSLGGRGEEYEPTPREAEIALRAYESTGLRVAGVDAMRSIRGPLITEVNSNPGFKIEELTGRNVAGAIVDLAIRSLNLSV